MNSTFRFLSLLLLVLFSTQISFASEPIEALTRKAVSENNAASSAAIEELRSRGPAGLQALMTQYAGEIRAHIANPSAAPDEQWQRIATALDTVAQQKNSYIAGLYWHTDLDSAKKASAASGKPILSLRLLGKLTDEFSCANSRFFRTVLYPNAAVSDVLRERFVLHWESVRPVPTVTIDFGDGRKLERTLTGNSIHYILDSQARPIDALPGLVWSTSISPGSGERRDTLQIACRKERSGTEAAIVPPITASNTAGSLRHGPLILKRSAAKCRKASGL